VPLLTALDRRRSIAPDRLAPLLDVPGLHFVSLQKDGPAAPAGFGLTDVMAKMTDFADTAGLVANLDLVIAVDTAVVHLAAALGRPVWVLDRFDTCWRWLRGRRDSPWYPTLRLYRQPQPGDWAAVLAEVADDLRGLV
jgi:ADP-heptose:LPS heptosyltransferase